MPVLNRPIPTWRELLEKRGGLLIHLQDCLALAARTRSTAVRNRCLTILREDESRLARLDADLLEYYPDGPERSPRSSRIES